MYSEIFFQKIAEIVRTSLKTADFAESRLFRDRRFGLHVIAKSAVLMWACGIICGSVCVCVWVGVCVLDRRSFALPSVTFATRRHWHCPESRGRRADLVETTGSAILLFCSGHVQVFS